MRNTEQGEEVQCCNREQIAQERAHRKEKSQSKEPKVGRRLQTEGAGALSPTEEGPVIELTEEMEVKGLEGGMEEDHAVEALQILVRMQTGGFAQGKHDLLLIYFLYHSSIY